MWPGPTKCEFCVYPCKTCNSLTECLSCAGNPLNRRAAPSCKCENGYYNRDDECIKCELPCLNCTSPTNCVTFYDCHNAISGEYKHRYNYQCLTCTYPCITCFSHNQCHSNTPLYLLIINNYIIFLKRMRPRTRKKK